MPRRSRCVLPGVPCHITQRGVDRCKTFSCTQDRLTYLRLLRENLHDTDVSLLGFCLMTNHVHLVAIPAQPDSLAVLLRRLHGRYAQYFNTRSGRTGHLWQNRFFACVLGQDHLWSALAYVERNPLRARMVDQAAEYRWSSAGVHLGGPDEFGVVDLAWWQQAGRAAEWAQTLSEDDVETGTALRRCTYAGRPFGDASFLERMSLRFNRSWVRGRPGRRAMRGAGEAATGRQMMLIAE